MARVNKTHTNHVLDTSAARGVPLIFLCGWTQVMESRQLGQIRGDRADHPGDSRQLCNGSEKGDKAQGGDVFKSDKVAVASTRAINKGPIMRH